MPHACCHTWESHNATDMSECVSVRSLMTNVARCWAQSSASRGAPSLEAERLRSHFAAAASQYCNIGEKQTMVNPGSSSQPPPVTAGSLSWKRCAGCGGKIADRFLLYAMDSYWHSRCLKCSCCQAQLGDIGTSCYTKSGMILCRNDYIRLFGNSGACSACGQSIPASELVMRAQGNVYHLKCFTCSTCRNRLVPGDRFHYINGSLFCEHDRPTALINGHLNSLQSNPLLPDQKKQGGTAFPEHKHPHNLIQAVYHKAHIARWCERGTDLGVREHLESNSSPEGKSNGNSD
ncbi:LIM domain transcription factor LMO4 [Sciurus carolinensis]|uniref:LIM domain transcription factor LMO4 n=1 Tax=Sciurus carolinensis TaxID=30640 RepID=A0AA41NJU2_SCICA|nr:LIM domain transcription factor LMO4 [Sciurus carolinensis]